METQGISTCILTYSLYNLFFHPLRSFPGPILWRAFRVPYLVRALQGRLAFDLLGLHKNYGPIVRIAPNELALAFDGVWDKVQGGTYDNEMAKLKPYYRVQASQTDFIMTAPSEDHAQMRRALSHGFSDRGIRDMESRMIAMLDKMLGRLLALCRCRDSMPTDRPARKYEAVIDLAKWCNFLTFDMIGELAFGESYKCLETATYHPWVEPIVQLTHYSGILAVLGFYPTLQALLLSVFGGVISQRMESHQEHSRVALERRAKRPDRTDLLSQSLKQANASKDVSVTALYSFINGMKNSR
jgi:cytochrome P450